MKPSDYHIAIIGPYAYQPFYSINQLCKLLEREFVALGCTASIHTPPGFLGEFTEGGGAFHKAIASFERITFSPARMAGKLRSLQRQLKKENKKLLVVVSDQALSSMNIALGEFEVVQFVSDLIAIRESRGEFGGPKKGFGQRYNQNINLGGLANAIRFVTPSQSTKNDLMRLLPSIHSGNIAVAPLTTFFEYGVADQHSFQSKRDALWRRLNRVVPNYILHVGSSAWYKNRTGLIRLMGALKQTNNVIPALVFAGGAPTVEEMALIKEFEIDFYHFDKPSDEDLNVLYTGAFATVLPSFAEGFCWPALEALCSASPLVISATPCLGEHFGDAAAVILPDPTGLEPDEWVGESLPFMQELLDADDNLIENIIEQGLQHAQNFNSIRFQETLLTLLKE